jgi:hypothetical protein
MPFALFLYTFLIPNSRKTLLPVESHSDINTSNENFTYSGNKISGTIVAKEGNKKGVSTTVDTAFLTPMFNGLIYAETYQALSYQKNHPFYLAEYVPGHNTKFTKVEYIRDDEITISGAKIAAKVLEMNTGQITIYLAQMVNGLFLYQTGRWMVCLRTNPRKTTSFGMSSTFPGIIGPTPNTWMPRLISMGPMIMRLQSAC